MSDQNSLTKKESLKINSHSYIHESNGKITSGRISNNNVEEMIM